jgi:hypothetical protein
MSLATFDPSQCPECGADLGHEQVDQPALIRHAGYGATRRTITRHCTECSYSLKHVITETRP